MSLHVEHIFPTYLIKFKFDRHQKYADIFDDLTDISENQPHNWSGRVYTSCNTKDSILDSSIQNDICHDIQECIQKNMPNEVDIRINDFWYNIYKKNFCQESHDHCDILNFLSGIYFNKNATSPTFINSQTSILKSMGFATVLQNSWFDNVRPTRHVPDVEDGDILIFPSDLSHEVPRYISDDLRITFSFNITLKPSMRKNVK